jgi:hypothetical protein
LRGRKRPARSRWRSTSARDRGAAYG